MSWQQFMREMQNWVDTIGDIMDDPNTPNYAEHYGLTPYEVDVYLGDMMAIIGDDQDRGKMRKLISTDEVAWSLIGQIFKRYDAGSIFRDIEDWANS